MTREQISSAINAQYSIIIEQQGNLSSEDYKIVKCAEAKMQGGEMPYDTEVLIAARNGYRRAISDAQDEIARLEALEPEDPEPEAE